MIIIIIVLTNFFTKNFLKKDMSGCRTEYFASNVTDEEDLRTDEEKRIEKMKDICIMCNGRDNLSNNPNLLNVLNRLEDFYYV